MKKHMKYRQKKRRRVDLSLLLLTLGAAAAALFLVILSSFSLHKYFSEKAEAGQEQGEDSAATTPAVVTEPQTAKVQEPIVRPQGVGAAENYRALYFDLGKLETAQQLRALAQQARDAGYTAVLIDAKAPSGLLHYASDVPTATALGLADAEKLTARQLIRILHENNLFVTVRLCAFADNAAAAADTAMALKTVQGDTFVQDSARRLDPASEKACDYALSLMRELDENGADEISLCEFGYPLLGAEETAAGEEERFAAVASFAASAQAAVREAALSFEITPQELIAPKSARTGIDLSVLRERSTLFVLNCIGRTLTDNLRAAAADYSVRLFTESAEAVPSGFCGIAEQRELAGQ